MFYTYIHMRKDDGKVFYVGKGTGGRAYQKSGRSKHWRRVVDKHGLVVEIAARWQTEPEAFDHERLLIAVLRELCAPLVNVTDGGEGTSGAKQSPEVIQKRLLATSTPEAKARKSAALRASWSDPEARARRLARFAITPEEAAQRDAELAEKARARRVTASVAAKRKWADPEYRNKVTAAIKRTKASVASKTRQSEITKALFAAPEYREKVLAAIAERSRSVEGRRRTAEHFKRVWANPDHRRLMCRQVVCLDTGVRFESASEAARSIGQSKANLHKVCEGKRKTCGGLRFAWV